MKRVLPSVLFLLLIVWPIFGLADDEAEESQDSSGHPPWAVLGELRLNGKFDVSYERHSFRRIRRKDRTLSRTTIIFCFYPVILPRIRFFSRRN